LGQQVEVYTRNVRGQRGTLQGRLEAFDRHFNLVLRGAEERFCVEGHPELRVRRVPLLFLKGDGVILVRPLPS
jgi:small nuclear ribonucleoprotein (snRNP)-like protein